jgi:hypothetical protein
MWTVARTSKQRKRKSSGTKTAWVFSYEPFANEAIANLDGIAALPRKMTKFTAGPPSTGLSNATQSLKRFLVTGRQTSLEQVLQRGLIGSG